MGAAEGHASAALPMQARAEPSSADGFGGIKQDEQRGQGVRGCLVGPLHN